MLDLYYVYKQYYQRWYRKKENLDFCKMKDISHDLVKKFYDLRNDQVRTEENRVIAVEIAKDLIAGLDPVFQHHGGVDAHTCATIQFC